MIYAARTRRLTWPRSILGLSVITGALTLGGCHAAPPAPPAPSLAVDVVGCAAVTKSGAGSVTCELGESRTMRVVLPAGATSARASVADRICDAGAAALETGPILSIDVPPEATSVVVEATTAGGRQRATVAVASGARWPWLEEARRARGNGDVEQASSLATAHLSDPDPVARALAKGLLARIALARGRSDDASSLFREAIELHRGVGRVSDASDDSFALAFALHQRGHRYTEARAVLDAAEADTAHYAEGRARAPYYRGVLAGETGNRRQALSLLREAEQTARRLGMGRLERNARAAVALELQELGRTRASLSILGDLENELEAAARSPTKTDPAPSACERVELANNRGWAALLANEAALARGEIPTEDARRPLDRALAIEGCADAYVRAFALANLARLALSEGDLPTAEKRLAEARTRVKEPRGTERIAWLDLEARILVARGRGKEALRILQDALTLARASMLRGPEWNLLVSRGEALASVGRTSDAVETLRAAEDVLDDTALRVPLGEGRSAFTGGRSKSARTLFGLLVAAGQLRDAARTAQRAQARVLAGAARALRIEELSPPERARWEEAVRAFRTARAAIDAEAAEDWKLPQDALRRAIATRADREAELRTALETALAVLEQHGVSPKVANASSAAAVPSGVLEVDIYPDLHGFVAIAVDDHEASTHRVPRPGETSLENLAHALLDPLRAKLDARTTLKIRTYGAWRSVDVHALPWLDEPLIARIPIVYAVGNDPTHRGAPPPSAPRSTLVIGDPTSDLPNALLEARVVARALEQRDAGTDAVRILVGDTATSAAVMGALRGAQQLHYAGHAIFAGEEGWQSALPLSRNGRLTVGDILALAPAPRTVVLTGCEAGRSNGDAEGLGLAQAFIVAGSDAVLAPVRSVADELAASMATALYREPPASGAALTASAREAILALRREKPSSDWAAFRVFVR